MGCNNSKKKQEKKEREERRQKKKEAEPKKNSSSSSSPSSTKVELTPTAKSAASKKPDSSARVQPTQSTADDSMDSNVFGVGNMTPSDFKEFLDNMGLDQFKSQVANMPTSEMINCVLSKSICSSDGRYQAYNEHSQVNLYREIRPGECSSTQSSGAKSIVSKLSSNPTRDSWSGVSSNNWSSGMSSGLKSVISVSDSGHGSSSMSSREDHKPAKRPHAPRQLPPRPLTEDQKTEFDRLAIFQKQVNFTLGAIKNDHLPKKTAVPAPAKQPVVATTKEETGHESIKSTNGRPAAPLLVPPRTASKGASKSSDKLYKTVSEDSANKNAPKSGNLPEPKSRA